MRYQVLHEAQCVAQNERDDIIIVLRERSETLGERREGMSLNR